MIKSRSLILFLTFTFTCKAVYPLSVQKNFTNNEKNTIKVFQESVHSVVHVSTIQRAKVWNYGTVEVPSGSGSGFVWDKNGHIITNYHVVAGRNASYNITFHKDRNQYKAKVIGVEPKLDIAILKLENIPKSITPIQIGSSKKLLVGQKAIAIGNPFGLDSTLTTGIVSALERKIEGVGGVKIHGMIQTDASINPGNSGGPLLNSSGQLIGMNTIIYSKSGSSSGIGFAVPADSISRVVPQLIKFGKVIRPSIGIGILPDSIKEQFGIENGIVISYVIDGGPAKKARLRPMGRDRFGRYYLGDILLKINDDSVNTYDDIFHTLTKYKIGDRVIITYKRRKKIYKKTITLDKN